MALQSKAESVTSEIQDAFRGIEYPGDEAIAYAGGATDNLEARQVAMYFKGKHWKDVDWAFIREYDEFADASACLSFMSPQGFRFYLPAFLLAVVNHYREAGLIADTTVSKLTGPKKTDDQATAMFIERRLNGFDASQRAAILSFLTYLKENHGDDFPTAAIDDAADFWR